MQRLFSRTTIWVGVTVLFSVVAFAKGQQQAPTLPDGPGKQILNRACTSCHNLDPILSSRLPNKEGYSDMVSAMMGAGAIVSAQEVPILVDYLFANLGAKPASKDDPGKAIFDKACEGCHSHDGLENQPLDNKDAYKALVTKMVPYGAAVTEAEMPVLVDYLFKTYGKK